MWHKVISQAGFVSNIQKDELSSSGKWLVPAALGDPDDIHERLVIAAASGTLLGVKLSNDDLDGILGFHLACVYAPTSDAEAASRLLARLREMGISGDLEFKSDFQTEQDSDQILWTSSEFEAGPGFEL